MRIKPKVRTCRNCTSYDNCMTLFHGTLSAFERKFPTPADMENVSNAIFKGVGLYCKDYERKVGKT